MTWASDALIVVQHYTAQAAGAATFEEMASSIGKGFNCLAADFERGKVDEKTRRLRKKTARELARLASKLVRDLPD